MAYTYSLLASTTVGAGGTSAITFSNIPQNYTDLIIKISGRAVATSDFPGLNMTINGTTTGYSSKYILGNGSAASSGSNTNISSSYLGSFVGSAQTANTFNNVEVYIPNYSNGSINKSISSDSGAENNATAGIDTMTANIWSNTTAINSISISTAVNLAQYSSVSIYGIRATEY